ncbi:hypothetical protein ACH3XW_26920 [Acanthocheilonema viteae]
MKKEDSSTETISYTTNTTNPYNSLCTIHSKIVHDKMCFYNELKSIPRVDIELFQCFDRLLVLKLNLANVSMNYFLLIVLATLKRIQFPSPLQLHAQYRPHEVIV